MIALRRLWMFAVVLAGPACATAAMQSADAPEYRVGDVWTFEQTATPGNQRSSWSREVVAISAAGDEVVMKLEDGGKRRFDAHGNALDRRGGNFVQRRVQFPMSIGRTWTYDREIPRGDEQASFKVVGAEPLTTPAGRFECLRVEGIAHGQRTSMTSTFNTMQKSTTKTTYWYCPEVRFVARWIVEEQSSLGMPWSQAESVLTSYRLVNP